MEDPLGKAADAEPEGEKVDPLPEPDEPPPRAEGESESITDARRREALKARRAIRANGMSAHAQSSLMIDPVFIHPISQPKFKERRKPTSGFYQKSGTAYPLSAFAFHFDLSFYCQYNNSNGGFRCA